MHPDMLLRKPWRTSGDAAHQVQRRHLGGCGDHHAQGDKVVVRRDGSPCVQPFGVVSAVACEVVMTMDLEINAEHLMYFSCLWFKVYIDFCYIFCNQHRICLPRDALVLCFLCIPTQTSLIMVYVVKMTCLCMWSQNCGTHTQSSIHIHITHP